VHRSSPLTQVSNEDESVWVWTTEDGQQLYFDKGERVRFRIEQEIWTDLAPTDQPPKLSQAGDAAPPGPRMTQVSDEKGHTEGKIGPDAMSLTTRRQLKSYELRGSMQQGGLGCIAWW